MNKKLIVNAVISFMMFSSWLAVLWVASYMLIYQPEITLNGRLVDPYGAGIVMLYFNWLLIKSFDEMDEYWPYGLVEKHQEERDTE